MTTQTERAVDRLTEKIERRFNELSSVQERMDKDYGRYRMDAFKPLAGEAIAKTDSFTSNLDRVVADKVVFGIAASERVIRVENDAAWQQREDANDNLERLAIGLLNLADKRMEDRGDPPVQDALGWHSAVRGRYVIARALLMKDPQGDTIVDILPMDPRNFVFERGADGVRWCAYKTMRSRNEIREAYPGFRFEDGPVSTEDDDGNTMETLYDYYERRRGAFGIETHNGVIVDHKWAKKLTNTGAVRWPIIQRAVGSMPTLANVNVEGSDVSIDFGESVFALNRAVTPTLNRLISYHITIVAQQADRAYKTLSDGGGLTFDRTPLRKGAETALDASAHQQVELFELPQTGRDAVVLQSVLVDHHQAGGLSAQALSGQPPPGGLSAAALRLLGNNLGERTRPFLKPVESCLLGCLEALIAQYETDAFRPVRVFGKTLAGKPFDREIAPQDIAGHGTLTVKLLQNLPEDDQLKWATARMAVNPAGPNGEALLSVQAAREQILGLQDSSLETERQQLDKGKAMAPVLALVEMRDAAIRRGDMNMAQYLDGRIDQQLLKEWMEEQALRFQFIQQVGGPQGMMAAAQGMNRGMNGGMNGNGQRPAQGQGAGQGMMQGIEPGMASVEQFMPGTVGATPSPTAGMNTTAPRPGAGNIDARLMEDMQLANIGLVRG